MPATPPLTSPRIVAILRNPWSGPRRRSVHVWNLLRGLKRHGFSPRLFSSRRRLQLWMEQPQNRERLFCLVAAGGDGTICDLVTRYPGVRLATIPLGTENLLARLLKIPRSGQFVADMIAAGTIWQIDICRTERQRFCLMASIGFDAAVVHRTHAGRRGHIYKFSYLGPIWATIRSYRYPQLRVWLDDATEPERCRLLVVANHAAYALGLRVVPEALGDDGLVDVRLFKAKSFWSTLKLLWCAWRGKLHAQRNVVWKRAKRVRIEADAEVPIQIDGDPAGTTPVTIDVLAGELQLFVPPHFSPGAAGRMLKPNPTEPSPTV